ncbi:MAG TPA: SBBP repeat-containing protein [Terriglobales bacterium]
MRRSVSGRKTGKLGKKTGNWMKAAFLAAAVLATAGVVFYFSTAVHAAKASGPKPPVHKALSSTALSLPLFFEPNHGQTAPQVKFLARGAGYGLFLTADEAVLQLQRAVSTQHSALSSQRASSSVIRMRLDGANASARVSGASPLPGKSSYFIGNDPSKWHRDIPQFARVQYQAVYPGVDLVYYGNQGQLEYDFRVAPGAEPSQIALSFNGASAHIDSGDSGDLILATANGDVRFRAPHVYQPAAPQSGNAEKAVAGSFRQLADNKIGFTIGDYDRNRELVIDPELSYSTYLGGSLAESLVRVAIGPDNNIYLAGSTMSQDFPPAPVPPANPPFQAHNAGTQNIFIAVINPDQPPAQQLLYTTYLGGSQFDFAAGIGVSTAVDSGVTGSIDVYVAGSTSSPDFPTNSVLAPFQPGPPVQPGVHGFVTRLNLGTTTTLRYSTYLAGTNGAGNATDTVTGLAIDKSGDAFVTGITTSTDDASNGFPANGNGFPAGLASHAPNQFFASKINTQGADRPSMIYSTYFGGGNPQSGKTQGGGIAVDASGNMYITGGTNFLPVDGPNPGEVRFPLFNAQQSCLDEAGKTAPCTLINPTALDAFVAKIDPKQLGSNPVYSTYVGGQGDDVGFGIAVDSTGNAYITGSTNSTDFIPSSIVGSAFQKCLNNTNPATPCPTSSANDAFIAKINNAVSGSLYPLNYATYIGGSGDDSGQAIQVDSVQGAHVTGSTGSLDLPVTTDAPQLHNGGGQDAFVALISTTLSGQGAGDYLTYLGGGNADQGTGIATDNNIGATYVAGNTLSTDFPTQNPYQPHLNLGSQDAFVSKLGANSALIVTPRSTSPLPNPVNAGTQVAFTFDITNTGPDNASLVTFYTFGWPTTGLASTPTAKIISGGSGSCSLQGSTFSCNIGTLAVNAVASVEVDLTPAIPVVNSKIFISGNVSANGGQVGPTVSQPTANVVDFAIAASIPPHINAGDTATIQVTFTPNDPVLGYNATITPSQTTSPSMVTATTPTFNPITVTLFGSASATTTLSIATVARPVTTGSLLRRGSFYAAWLPIGGLSLVGLGIGAGRKRRRWLVGAVLCLIAGAILLQSGCGSSSSSVTPGGGTSAGTYIITITGSAGTGASHNTQVQLTVH